MCERMGRSSASQGFPCYYKAACRRFCYFPIRCPGESNPTLIDKAGEPQPLMQRRCLACDGREPGALVTSTACTVPNEPTVVVFPDGMRAPCPATVPQRAILPVLPLRSSGSAEVCSLSSAPDALLCAIAGGFSSSVLDAPDAPRGNAASEGKRSVAFCGAHLLMIALEALQGGIVIPSSANDLDISCTMSSTSGAIR